MFNFSFVAIMYKVWGLARCGNCSCFVLPFLKRNKHLGYHSFSRVNQINLFGSFCSMFLERYWTFIPGALLPSKRLACCFTCQQVECVCVRVVCVCLTAVSTTTVHNSSSPRCKKILLYTWFEIQSTCLLVQHCCLALIAAPE